MMSIWGIPEVRQPRRPGDYGDHLNFQAANLGQHGERLKFGGSKFPGNYGKHLNLVAIKIAIWGQYGGCLKFGSREDPVTMGNT